MAARRQTPVINDFCIAEDWYTHWKREKLLSFYDDEIDRLRMESGLFRLWRWATCRGGSGATFDGHLGDRMQQIAHQAGWSMNDPRVEGYLEALVQSELLERRDGAWWVHDLHENQPHVLTILGKIAKRREAGSRGGKASGEARKQIEATGSKPKQTEANASKSNDGPSKRTPEAEAEAEAEAERKKRESISAAEVSEVREAWNAVAEKHGFPIVTDCKTRSEEIRKALKREDFREHWRDMLANVEELGAPSWMNGGMTLSNFMRKSHLTPIKDREWWGGKPKGNGSAPREPSLLDWRPGDAYPEPPVYTWPQHIQEHYKAQTERELEEKDRERGLI